MDIASLKAKAIEETTRVFLDKQGYVPDEDSDEWEEEYRRQFARLKARLASAPAAATTAPKPAAAAGAATAAEPEWPALRGAPADARWAASLRAERLKTIADPELRGWLGGTWTTAKSWIDTREHPLPAFLRLVAPRFAEYRREAGVREAALAAERQVKEAEAAKLAEAVRAAGITLAGLVELVDVCARTKPAAAKAKLAELHAGDRRLRIFETASETALLVLESHGAERLEYGIERDEGLVADLKLFSLWQTA
jgi:hypothetical protein